VSDEEELLSRAYTAYNGQDVDLRTPAAEFGFLHER
jgi:hypothetical protein